MGFRDCLPVFPLLFGVSAWIMTIWSNFLCNSVKFEPQDNINTALLNITLPDGTLPDLNYGLWNHKGYAWYYTSSGGYYVVDTCIGWSGDVDMDSKWKTAQAFSIIAFFFGFLALLATCVMAPGVSEQMNGKNLMLLSALYMFVTLSQGLTLIQLSSDFCKNPLDTAGQVYKTDCSWSSGIKVNIAATVLYFCAGLACCGIVPVSGQEEGEGEATAGGVEEEQQAKTGEEEPVAKADDEGAEA